MSRNSPSIVERPWLIRLRCVTDGCNDLSNQAAYGMAQNVDPSGDRTVGVITKCDVTQNFESVRQFPEVGDQDHN